MTLKPEININKIVAELKSYILNPQPKAKILSQAIQNRLDKCMEKYVIELDQAFNNLIDSKDLKYNLKLIKQLNKE